MSEDATPTPEADPAAGTAPVPPPPGAALPAAPAPAAPPAQWPSQGYAAPEPAAAPPAPTVPPTTTSSNAIVSLILAAASWIVCPVVPAIVALVFAQMAAKEIAARPTELEGKGLVTASRIVSWINIGFWAALLVIGLFTLLLLAIAGAFDRNR
jgi:hypothetical protein